MCVFHLCINICMSTYIHIFIMNTCLSTSLNAPLCLPVYHRYSCPKHCKNENISTTADMPNAICLLKT